MLALSLALHASLAGGLALYYFRGAPAPVLVSVEPTSPTIILLQSRETPVREVARKEPAKPATPVLATPLPVVQPHAPEPILAKAVPIEPPAFALEANPNAHVRPFAPDAVLSPNPPPQLNSADGVVFILDISGSMYEAYDGSTRLALARQYLSQQIRGLKDGTPFAVTLYALSARNSGPLVAASPATREAAVRFIMHDANCGGGTNLPAGFASAQRLHPGSLILATDGDLNTSGYALAAKARSILGPAGRCPLLTVIGVAPREEQGADRLLQGLADEQGGTYATAQTADSADLISSASGAIKPANATP